MGWRRVPESKRSGPCPGQEDEGEVRAGPRARLPPTPEGQCEDAARLQGPIPPITPSPGTSVCTSVNRTPSPTARSLTDPETVLTPHPPSAAVVSSGTAWGLEPHVAATGSFGKRHTSCRTPAQGPRGFRLAHRRHRTDSTCCPPVRSSRPLAFLAFGRTKPVPTQGLCTCPSSAWHPHSRSPPSTSQNWSPFKCLSDLSRPNCPCARPWPRRSLCLMACLLSVLCSNHCPPDRVSLFTVCTSLPPSRLAGPPGKALSPVLCCVRHIAGAP